MANKNLNDDVYGLFFYKFINKSYVLLVAEGVFKLAFFLIFLLRNGLILLFSYESYLNLFGGC